LLTKIIALRTYSIPSELLLNSYITCDSIKQYYAKNHAVFQGDHSTSRARSHYIRSINKFFRTQDDLSKHTLSSILKAVGLELKPEVKSLPPLQEKAQEDKSDLRYTKGVKEKTTIKQEGRVK